MNLLAVSFAAVLVVNGGLSAGKLVALVAAIPVIMAPINLFAQISIQYFQGRESFRSIKELVDSGYVEQWKGTRRQCAIVMQDSMLLSGTILDNLRFGRPHASEAEAIEAARQANAWDFISELPKGLMTKVGERGVSLSGGQRQRIAIDRLVKGRTTITIAHRLSTIRNADCVYVLENGKLVEAGSYAELERTEGSAFAQLLRTVGNRAG